MDLNEAQEILNKNGYLLERLLDGPILDELGYESKIYYLNASNFGSSQNRKRAYGLSILKS